MLQVLPMILALLKAGIEIAPVIIEAAETEMALFRANAQPSPEELATISQGLDAANSALQQEALAIPTPAVLGAG
jgi:hypothetical protein